jgi:hypothetical protein
MVAPIRQIVTVGADGQIELRVSSLPAGSRAEVTVVPAPADVGASLQALDELQASLRLSRQQAGEWAKQIQTERESFPRG